MTAQVFTLDDGTQYNANQLAEVLGCTHSSARRRLKMSSDPKVILAPCQPPGGKEYVLDDGTRLNVKKLIEMVPGLKRTTAATRLAYTSDPKKIFKPALTHSDDYVAALERELQREIESRMYYDPDGHWSLLNKCL